MKYTVRQITASMHRVPTWAMYIHWEKWANGVCDYCGDCDTDQEVCEVILATDKLLKGQHRHSLICWQAYDQMTGEKRYEADTWVRIRKSEVLL